MRAQLRIFRASAAVGLADLRAIYTWRTWAFAWLSRILCQVAFFSLVGRLLRSPAEERFLLIGNAVYIVSMIAMFACVSAAWERQAGTLPLLLAAPSSTFIIFAGRSINWLIDGTACASISVFALSPLFHLALPWPGALLVVPLVACTGISTTCFALTMAGITMRNPGARNLVTNISYYTLMVLCGAEVPLQVFPRWLRIIADCLPLTHGLQAVRALLSGRPAEAITGQAALELAVGACWLTGGWLAFTHLATSGRAKGTIEYGT